MRKRGVQHFVAVYYNRKVVHILAGGLCAIIISFNFKTAILILVKLYAPWLLTLNI